MDKENYHKQIVNYYDTTEIDYKLIWDLRDSQAMHYGYWDHKVKTYKEALIRENEILAERANVKDTDIILDAGCGVGGSSIFLAKKFGCKVIGITLSGKQKNTATKNALRAGVSQLVEFRVMDYENMIFPDNTFDVVWGIESICHAKSKKKFIENAYRVLKTGGRLIVADFFATKENYLGLDKSIVQKWLSGWAVNFLETANNFGKFLLSGNFQKISFIETTKNVLPSARYLYKCSFPAIVIDTVLRFFRLRNKIQMQNVVAARYQYIALKKNLWKYGIFYAEKN